MLLADLPRVETVTASSQIGDVRICSMLKEQLCSTHQSGVEHLLHKRLAKSRKAS